MSESALPCRQLSHGRIYGAPSISAPTVLFVHGGFHGAWCWSQTLSFLAARGLGAVAVDLRGHGGLPQDAGFIAQGVAEMIDDVVEAAETMSGPVFLAGHSLGALIAMKASARISVRGMILLAPAAPAGVATVHSLPRFSAEHPVAPPGEERARKWFMSGAPSADLTRYVAKLCPESPRLLNECFHAGVAIADISCPLLCLSGGKDDSPLHPAGQDQAVAARHGASLHVIERSGHCMMLDDGWREAADVVSEWVAAH